MRYILLLVAAALLYASNPTIRDFNFFLKSEVVERLQSQDDTVSLLATEIFATAALDATYRKNYLLFSMYTVDTAGLRLFAPDLPVKVSILAVAGNFILLDKIEL